MHALPWRGGRVRSSCITSLKKYTLKTRQEGSKLYQPAWGALATFAPPLKQSHAARGEEPPDPGRSTSYSTSEVEEWYLDNPPGFRNLEGRWSRGQPAGLWDEDEDQGEESPPRRSQPPQPTEGSSPGQESSPLTPTPRPLLLGSKASICRLPVELSGGSWKRRG